MNRLEKLLLATAVILWLIAENAAAQPPAGSATPAAPAAATPAPADNLPWVSLRAALDAPDNSMVYVRARLVSLEEPRPNSKQPYSFHLSDATGTGRMVAFANIYAQIQNSEQFKAGVELEIYAKTGEYKGERQLTLERASYIRVRPGSASTEQKFRPMAAPAQTGYLPVTVAAISKAMVGRKVELKGTIDKLEPSKTERNPYRLFVKDDTGTVLIVYWPDVAAKLDPALHLDSGKPITVNGTVTEFRDTLQIRIDSPEQLLQK